jgi:hypothetical protein
MLLLAGSLAVEKVRSAPVRRALLSGAQDSDEAGVYRH